MAPAEQRGTVLVMDVQPPRSLSPSRAQDFKQCARKYYYRAVERRPTRPSVAAAVGTIAHSALERLFDHPRGQRSPELGEQLARDAFAAWQETAADDLSQLREDDPAVADRILERALHAVAGYFRIENPNRFDPEARELRISAEAAGVPLFGIIDRLDKAVAPSGRTYYYISDYKTGKVPAADDPFLDEKFFAMRVYALMAKVELGIDVHELRLIYVTGADPGAVRRVRVDAAMLNRTRRELRSIWYRINRAVVTGVWEPRVGPLCQWCDFQDVCPAFNPHPDGVPLVPEGTVRS